MSCSYCPTQCSHSLHFILSHSLTISLSYLFVHSIFIILILVWLFDFEYLFLLICLVTKFWPTYSLISIIYPHISLSLVLIEAFYWAFTPTSACTHNYTFIQRQTNWHFPCSLLTIPFFTFLWNEQSTPLYYCEPLIMRYSTRIWSLLCKNYNPALESRPF